MSKRSSNSCSCSRIPQSDLKQGYFTEHMNAQFYDVYAAFQRNKLI